jgi:imidazolonepropionase-like amidohydrolase
MILQSQTNDKYDPGRGISSLDERPGRPDHPLVQTLREPVLMRIDSLLAVAALVGIYVLSGAAFAAAEEGGGNTASPQAVTEEVAQPTTATPVTIEEGATLKAEEPPMEQRAAPETTLRVRSTRPRNDTHRDARACLEKGNKTAIIICAEKYR